MHQRVACQGQGRFGRPCGAHRDLALSAVCFICGSHHWAPVAVTPGDCYQQLSRWAGELLTLRSTDDVLSLISALTVSSRLADTEQATRR